MRTGYLTRAGGFTVEQVVCPDYGKVDAAAPPKGVLHTTEGSFESALAVFRQRNAPHFLVGRDSLNRVRILQLVRLGRVAGALENHPGGVETNRVCRVQVEIAGRSQHASWLPDDAVTDALARLMATLVDAADIPLQHHTVGRDPETWLAVSGWVGHADVPENTHWDPGGLKWAELLYRAAAYLEPIVDVDRDGVPWLLRQKPSSPQLWARVKQAAAAGRRILIRRSEDV